MKDAVGQNRVHLCDDIKEANEVCTKVICTDHKSKKHIHKRPSSFKKGSKYTQNIWNLTGCNIKEIHEYYRNLTEVNVPYPSFSSAIRRGDFKSRTFENLEKKILKYFKEFGKKKSKKNNKQKDFSKKFIKFQNENGHHYVPSPTYKKTQTSESKSLKKTFFKVDEKTLSESVIDLVENSYEQELLKLKDYIENKLKEIA